MAILAFQRPDKVIMNHSTETFGQFEFRPLEPGYGITVGNALRRILLSSLEGFAITSVKLSGVDHEFSTISVALVKLSRKMCPDVSISNPTPNGSKNLIFSFTTKETFVACWRKG